MLVARTEREGEEVLSDLQNKTIKKKTKESNLTSKKFYAACCQSLESFVIKKNVVRNHLQIKKKKRI